MPEPGGADQADDVVLVHGEVDLVEHLQLAEPLVDAADVDERGLPVPVGGRRQNACARSRFSRWATMWSVKRASGIVIRMKNTAARTYEAKSPFWVENCCASEAASVTPMT